MKLVTVIPIVKGVFRGSLSYFTSKNIGVGALITVPVRKKTLPAIVTAEQEIKKAKTAVKKSEFALKAIKSVKAKSFLRPEFIETCKEIADYFISPVGPVIKDFVSQAILESADRLPTRHIDAARQRGALNEPILFQAPKKERLQYYKSIIREEFAKKSSVFFCLPTTTEINEFFPELQKGIEKYSLILHAKMPKKKMEEIWGRALREKHPVLIIATKSFLSLPRGDIGTLIIEGEGSPFYKLQTRPYADARKMAEILASKTGMRLIFGDNVIRTETYHKIGPVPVSRTLTEAEKIIVNMNKQSGRIFSTISKELQAIMADAREKNEKIILFVNRRGHSPTTVCNDCLRTILCEKCETPLVLHKESSKNKNAKFICHKCLIETTAPERCPYCGSWRLRTLGIGIQKIAEETAKLFPKSELFRIDGDAVKSQKQGEETAKNFLAAHGGILAGTEMMFTYINQPVERVAIISLDALFALPDFRINEKIFNLLLKLRLLAKKTFLAQTRLPEQTVFDDAIKGNISGFYKKELEERKQFQYPPFKTLIKITKENKNKMALKKEIQALETKLEQWHPLSYPAFTAKIKNLYSWHILIKIDPETWPNEQRELHQILSSLPPAWKVNVNPESLL